ncbi:MAG: hypothetical protein ACREFE_19775, partial [Limisphaerales bacterium]
FVEFQDAFTQRHGDGFHAHTLPASTTFVKLHYLWKRSRFIIGFMVLFFFPDQAVLPITYKATFKDYLPLITTDGFLLLVWIFGVANLLEIRKRRKRGIEYYSYYWGRPRFLPDKPIVHWLVIPLCNGLIAFGVFKLFHALGIYLFLLTVMQFS